MDVTVVYRFYVSFCCSIGFDVFMLFLFFMVSTRFLSFTQALNPSSGDQRRSPALVTFRCAQRRLAATAVSYTTVMHPVILSDNVLRS